MPRRSRRRIWLAALVLFGRFGPEPPVASGQEQTAPPRSPTTLDDPRLTELRRASVTWEVRKGPTRQVADVVCLVPDVPTFLEALGTWDQGHAFPILLDDAETSLKFVRAFRPARIVRFPRRTGPVPPERLWERAVAAVGRAWTDRDDQPPAGDAVPTALSEPPPPGVVLSAPESPALAGAVALAAGRFQPLVRWDVARREADVLSSDEAGKLAVELERKVTALIPDALALGDRCDFLTLAGPWPYRFNQDQGPNEIRGANALDDLLGRNRGTGRRWAYVGRLIGDERTSVYRAMCSLFLQPEAATLFNSYAEQGEPWAEYTMRPAAQRLDGAIRSVKQVSGPAQADLTGWHRAFDPVNRTGLVLINTSGNPADFNLPGPRGGRTADIPMTDPAAVLIIHSFSAADPSDPGTLAGRWLANGAFVYFGSMNEPYLQAFRPPGLVADLIAERLPFVVAVRRTAEEPFGFPWRLIFLGDPLYRLLAPRDRPARQPWKPVASWMAYADAPAPGAEATDAARLAWTLKTALVRAARPRTGPVEKDLEATLLAIRREAVPEPYRPTYDALLVDILVQNGDLAGLQSRLGTVPTDRASADRKRWLETVLRADLERALAAADWSRAGAVWADLVRSDLPADLKADATGRVAALYEAAGHLREWCNRLLSVLQTHPRLDMARSELDRIAPKLGAEPPSRARARP